MNRSLDSLLTTKYHELVQLSASLPLEQRPIAYNPVECDAQQVRGTCISNSENALTHSHQVVDWKWY
jgi:hypothetical protein